MALSQLCSQNHKYPSRGWEHWSRRGPGCGKRCVSELVTVGCGGKNTTSESHRRDRQLKELPAPSSCEKWGELWRAKKTGAAESHPSPRLSGAKLKKIRGWGVILFPTTGVGGIPRMTQHPHPCPPRASPLGSSIVGIRTFSVRSRGMRCTLTSGWVGWSFSAAIAKQQRCKKPSKRKTEDLGGVWDLRDGEETRTAPYKLQRAICH